MAGLATLADSYHPSSPDPAGTWEARAMQLALDDAGTTPEQVSALVAHATATPKGDAAEIAAINSVYRPRRSPLPVFSHKGHIGHTGAASGAVSVMAAAHAMAQGSFPNTAGTRDVDPAAEFDVVTGQPVALDVRVVQVNAFGFGGQDSSVVVRRPAET